jgi:hypothetical protein
MPCIYTTHNRQEWPVTPRCYTKQADAPKNTDLLDGIVWGENAHVICPKCCAWKFYLTPDGAFNCELCHATGIVRKPTHH